MSAKEERLFNLHIMLLTTDRPVSARKIQRTIPGYDTENYDSFKRMFERDKEALREIGIPIVMQQIDVLDPEEGYIIPKDKYYLPDLDLSPDDLAELWLAAGLLRVIDQGPLWSGLMKLSGHTEALPERSPERVVADLDLGAPALPKFFEATTSRRTLTFSYSGKQRRVRPYSLVHRGGFWYVAGLDEAIDEIRTFRLDRISGSVKVLDPSSEGPDFEVPAGFDAATGLQAPPFAKADASLKARVRFDGDIAWWVVRSNPWLRMTLGPDGAGEVEIAVTDPEAFIAWVLGFGEGAELLAPPELRAQVVSRLERICG